MTQEQKDLLLKDLCARLLYGVVVATTDNDGTLPNFWTLDSYNRLTEDVFITNCELNADRLTYFCDVRPYLFPLSSMTEEQCYELASIRSGFQDCWKYIKTPIPLAICNFEQIEWFHKNHLDYRGLIPMGLAINATGLNIY